MVSILGILLIATAIYGLGKKTVQAPGVEESQFDSQESKKETSQLAEPTGKVDDAIESLETSILIEDRIIEDDDTLVQDGISDNVDISSFGQSYEEDEL